MSSPRAASQPIFHKTVFSAPEERCRRFTGWVLEHVEPSAALRVLDIGCGSGAQILELARAIPNAKLTGVDISRGSITLASRRARELSLDSRVSFASADYIAFPSQQYDLIISYSTLQLIPCDSKMLFSKIGNELSAGGLLMNVMPYDCTYNQVLMRVRQLLAVVRSPLTDALVFRVAKLVHGHELDDQMLRERVAYIYQRLERLDGNALHETMRNCGLEFVREVPEKHASVAQAKHRLTVFRKRSRSLQ